MGYCIVEKVKVPFIFRQVYYEAMTSTCGLRVKSRILETKKDSPVERLMRLLRKKFKVCENHGS